MTQDPTSVAAGEPAGAQPTTLPLDIRFEAHTHPRTAQQLAYEVVRRAILRGAVVPGTRLTQGQLAAQLELSTTPVREALRRLASEGLVRIDAHRGAIVRGLDKSELSEIYEVRLLLEPLAIRKAAERVTDAELVRAEELWEQMEDHSDVGAWSELNREFHGVFAGAAQSPRLTEILRGLRDSAAPYVRWSMVLHPDFPVTANREHRQLLDACRARNGELAARIEEQHLQATLAAVMAQQAGQST
ncbi:MAG: GntR family transcriptional regulator [Nocardioidaceae bacterium]